MPYSSQFQYLLKYDTHIVIFGQISIGPMNLFYSKFKTHKLKCENILAAEFASLPGERKSKMIFRWFRQSGTRNIPTLALGPQWDLKRDTVGQIEEFCKAAQTNELGAFSQAWRSMDKWYNPVQNNWLYRDIQKKPQTSCQETSFYLGCKISTIFGKCLSEAGIDWTADGIRQMAKRLDIRRAIAKHVKNQPASQLQAQVSHLWHQRVNLHLHEKKGKKRKLLTRLTNCK